MRLTPPPAATVPAHVVVRRLRVDAITARDEERWRALGARSIEANPFHEPDFLLPAMRHLGDRHLRLLVVEDPGGDWLACAPVRPVARRADRPFLGLAVWENAYGGVGVPLIDAHAPHAAAALVGRLRREMPRSAVVLVEVPAAGPGIAAIERAAAGTAVRLHPGHRPACRLNVDGEPASARMPARRRREVGRLRRRLERRHPGAAVVEPDPASDWVDDFLRLEAGGWKGAAGTAIASRPADARFFREAMRRLAARGRLHIAALVVDGRPIAMSCNVRSGSTMFGLRRAYDEAWSEYSPGHILDVAVIGLAEATPGLRLFDTMAEAGASPLRHVWPDAIPICTVAIPAHGPLGALTRPLIRARARRPG